MVHQTNVPQTILLLLLAQLAAGPIGYVAIGRDKTRKTNAKGTLVVTEKAIYCAGNVYPYDAVLAFTKKRKSILLLFEKSFNDQRFS